MVQRRPAGGAQAFGRPGRRERDVRVLAAVDDEVEELVERGGEVGVDVVAQVDARRQGGFGRAAQHLAVHGAAGVAVSAHRRSAIATVAMAPRTERPCGSAGAAAWRA